MRVVANPVLMRMAMLLMFMVVVFATGVWFMVRMRKQATVNLAAPTPRAENAPAFAVATRA